MHRIRRILARRGDLSAADCETCGFVHLDPLPEAADVAELYRTEFWQSVKPGAVGIMKSQLGWWQAIWGDWLMAIEDLGLRGDGTLLDIGAGFGHFVQYAQQSGWLASGVEPSEEAAAYAVNALGVYVERSFLDAIPQGALAHAVSAMWVLEHLLDPTGFLADLSYRAHTLLLAVPNEWTPLQMRASMVAHVPCWWLDKTHVNYFRRVDLERLLGRTGWRVRDELGTYPMEWCIVDGADYTADSELGKSLHAKVRAYELAMEREGRLKEYRNRVATGCRDLIVICESEHS